MSARSAARASAAATVVIVDDDPIVRGAVRQALAAEKALRVVGEAADGAEALPLLREARPDLLVLDMLMPRLPGLDTLRQLEGWPGNGIRTIVLCSHLDDRAIVEVLQLGARGAVLKDALGELPHAIAAVLRGHYWAKGRETPNVVQLLRELSPAGEPPPGQRFKLTKRELQVVRLVAQGLSNREIADALAITEDTTKRHLTNIFDKVGMSTRLELALFAIDHGLAVR